MKRRDNILSARPALGFTLIELMVVLVIIGILAGLTVGVTKYAWRTAAGKRAQSEIAAMETALESYKSDVGIYPLASGARGSTANAGVLYTSLVGGSKKYFTFTKDQTGNVGGVSCVIDPFGSPYNYYRNPSGTQSNSATFDLWSNGADGTESTADDLTNWK